MPSGTATLDFGSFPGSSHTTVAVTGQTGILAGSIVGAWLFPDTTTDHSDDEHLLEPIKIVVPKTSIIAGTGFTIHGLYVGPPESARLAERVIDVPNPQVPGENAGQRDPMAYGQFRVAWAWA